MLFLFLFGFALRKDNSAKILSFLLHVYILPRAGSNITNVISVVCKKAQRSWVCVHFFRAPLLYSGRKGLFKSQYWAGFLHGHSEGQGAALFGVHIVGAFCVPSTVSSLHGSICFFQDPEEKHFNYLVCGNKPESRKLSNKSSTAIMRQKRCLKPGLHDPSFVKCSFYWATLQETKQTKTYSEQT